MLPVTTMHRNNAAKRNANQENICSVPQHCPVLQKQRTVLGVLNENEQQKRSLCQVAWIWLK